MESSMQIWFPVNLYVIYWNIFYEISIHRRSISYEISANKWKIYLIPFADFFCYSQSTFTWNKNMVWLASKWLSFSDGYFSQILALITCGSLIWFTAIQTLRLCLKSLLSYKGWMYEEMGSISRSTILWMVN